jgi:DNA-binding IclR family transcriptional regulator
MIGPATPSIDDVIEAVEATRRRGYAVAEGAVFPDASAVSVATDIEANMRPLVVSVAGPTSRMKPRFAEIGRMIAETLRDARGAMTEEPNPSDRFGQKNSH